MSEGSDYKSTLNLPRTDFPMKANLQTAEPQALARWQEIGLYDRIRQARAGRPRFVLHFLSDLDDATPRDNDAWTAELAAKTQSDRVLVVQQTHEALVYIGHALLEAAAHTENAILKEAAPPLRNGFETVKNKVSHPI